MHEKPITWNVSRCSTMTDKVLKVVAGPFSERREAELWLEGFGQDAGQRTTLRIRPTRPVRFPKHPTVDAPREQIDEAI